MNERQEDSKGELPLSWFGKTLWKVTLHSCGATGRQPLGISSECEVPFLM